MNKLFTFVVLLFFVHISYAQVLNDDCIFATPIPFTDNYCSDEAEFTNIGAQPDPEFIDATNQCVALKWANGVWFSFVPKKPAVLIRVFSVGYGGTMISPKIVLFKRCGEFLSCSPGKDVGVDEFVYDNLTIGQTYFIMIESAVGGEGTFKLCIDDFTPVKSPEGDCKDAVVLCDKSSFVVDFLVGVGENANEIPANICIGQEFASAWYKWTCDQPGSLTFVLVPNNNVPGQVSDDLDFAVFELPGGLDDCENKRLIRCMASGANVGANGQPLPLSNWASCNGPTGLAFGETDEVEPPGCPPGNNSFLRPIDMEAGKSYVLIVNNYSRSGLGFGIEFGGTGTFLGPEPDFEINANQAFECDKSVIITNNSQSETDPIISYSWSFGNRSIPERGEGEGPHEVIYESFGNKTAALTVETSRGCLVTKIVEFFVEACCQDTSTLSLDAQITDLRCYGLPEGRILGIGSGGAPEYEFSIDGEFYRLNPLFGDLASGNYRIYIRDIKGCMDTLDVFVDQPEELIADAGPDKTIELSESTILEGSYSPSYFDVSVSWTPDYNLSDPSILQPDANPYRTTRYLLTVVQDGTGCFATDEMTVFVNANRDLVIPNIFTPNSDGINDYFTAYNVKAAVEIEELKIYDRWGNLMYETRNIPLGDPRLGWDGKFKGQKVNPGVYVYLFKVRFLDDEVLPFAGDITVLR